VIIMSAGIGNITNANVRDNIGTFVATIGGAVLAIDANKENVQTTAAIDFCIDGEWQTQLATIAEIDLSDTATYVRLNRKGEEIVSVPLPAGETAVYLMATAAAATVVIDPVEANASQDPGIENLSCPAGYCAYGAIKVVNLTNDFILGTTEFDATGVTTTFHQLAYVPASL